MIGDAYRAIRESYSRRTRTRGRSGYKRLEGETKKEFFERSIDPGVRLPVKTLSKVMKTVGSCEGHPHGVGHRSPRKYASFEYSYVFGRTNTQDAKYLSECMMSHGFDKFINIDKFNEYAKEYFITCPHCGKVFVDTIAAVCPKCDKFIDREEGEWVEVPSDTRMREDELTYQIMFVQYDEDPPGNASIRVYIFPKFRFTTETPREVHAIWDEARDRGWSAVLDAIENCT